MTTAPDLAFDHPCLAAGRVVLSERDKLAVSLEGETRDLTARRAPSCLLSPQPGDRVLVAFVPEPYVLAVLERDGARPAVLAFAADATLEAGGQLALAGNEGVSITTQRALSLWSRVLDLKASDAELGFERVTALAKTAQARFDKLGLFTRTYDLVAERIAERTKRVYRFVEELDQLRARHLDYRAEHTAQIKGENTVVTARQVVKIDGEQVHVG